MIDKKLLHIVSFALVILGAIDLGLYGIFGGNADIISSVFSNNLSYFGAILYALIGAAGVYLLLTHSSDCKACGKK